MANTTANNSCIISTHSIHNTILALALAGLPLALQACGSSDPDPLATLTIVIDNPETIEGVFLEKCTEETDEFGNTYIASCSGVGPSLQDCKSFPCKWKLMDAESDGIPWKADDPVYLSIQKKCVDVCDSPIQVAVDGSDAGPDAVRTVTMYGMYGVDNILETNGLEANYHSREKFPLQDMTIAISGNPQTLPSNRLKLKDEKDYAYINLNGVYATSSNITPVFNFDPDETEAEENAGACGELLANESNNISVCKLNSKIYFFAWVDMGYRIPATFLADGQPLEKSPDLAGQFGEQYFESTPFTLTTPRGGTLTITSDTPTPIADSLAGKKLTGTAAKETFIIEETGEEQSNTFEMASSLSFEQNQKIKFTWGEQTWGGTYAMASDNDAYVELATYESWDDSPDSEVYLLDYVDFHLIYNGGTDQTYTLITSGGNSGNAESEFIDFIGKTVEITLK